MLGQTLFALEVGEVPVGQHHTIHIALFVFLLVGVGFSETAKAQVPDVQQQVALLGSSDPKLRRKAAKRLGRYRKQAAVVVPALTRALYDTKWQVRMEAARALRSYGPKAKLAVPALIQCLSDSHWAVRSFAADALVKIGPGVVPSLLPLLAKSEPQLQGTTHSILRKFGPKAKLALSHLMALLSNKKFSVRRDAARTLTSLGSLAVGPLVKASRSTDPSLQVAALRALQWMKPVPDAGLTTFVDLLSHNNRRVRAASARCLRRMGKKAKPAVQALVLALNDSYSPVRYSAQRALATIGKPAQSGLIKACQHSNPKVRAAAVDTLGQMRPSDSSIVQVFVQALKDQHWMVRRAAAKSLGRMGGMAQPAHAALVKATKDPRRGVAILAQRALRRLGSGTAPTYIQTLSDPKHRQSSTAALIKIGKASTSHLIEALHHTHPSIRDSSADVLVKLLRKDATILPKLHAALRSQHKRTRLLTLSVLGKAKMLLKSKGILLSMLKREKDISVKAALYHGFGTLGPVAKEAIPLFVKGLDRDRPWLCRRAAEALSKMGPTVFPTLLQLLRGSSQKSRYYALQTLGQMKSFPHQVIKEIAVALTDTRNHIRVAAAEALGAAGQHGTSSVPALLKALHDKHPWVRSNAAASLGALRLQAARVAAALGKLLHDKHPTVQYEALKSLGNLGTPGQAFLLKALANQSWEIRFLTLRVLGRMGSGASFAMRQMQPLLRDKKSKVRRECVATFAKIGPNAAFVAPTLVAMLASKDWTLRRKASVALGSLGSKVIPVLGRALQHKDMWVRFFAVSAMGRMQGPLSDVLPHLIMALRDTEPLVREKAKTVMLELHRKMDPTGKNSTPTRQRLDSLVPSTRPNRR